MFASMFFLVVCFLVLVMFWKFFKKKKKKSNKKKVVGGGSFFECGFESSQKSRQTFSIRFFFILLLFVVFDVELGLLLQLPYHFLGSFTKSRFAFYVFLMVIFFGLMEEWRRGVLAWKK